MFNHIWKAFKGIASLRVDTFYWYATNWGEVRLMYIRADHDFGTIKEIIMWLPNKSNPTQMLLQDIDNIGAIMEFEGTEPKPAKPNVQVIHHIEGEGQFGEVTPLYSHHTSFASAIEQIFNDTIYPDSPNNMAYSSYKAIRIRKEIKFTRSE